MFLLWHSGVSHLSAGFTIIVNNQDIFYTRAHYFSFVYIRNTNPKIKNLFKWIEAQNCMQNVFHQNLISLTGWTTLSLAVVVLAALVSRAVCTSMAGTEVVQPVRLIKFCSLWSGHISASNSECYFIQIDFWFSDS